MSPRTGRPKSENPKSCYVKVRFDSDTNAKLMKYCQEHNMTKVEAVRRGIHLLLFDTKNKVVQCQNL